MAGGSGKNDEAIVEALAAITLVLAQVNEQATHGRQDQGEAVERRLDHFMRNYPPTFKGLLGIFIGCIIAKKIYMFVMLDTMFQHVLGISVRCWIRCSNILARFSLPCFMPDCTRALSY